MKKSWLPLLILPILLFSRLASADTPPARRVSGAQALGTYPASIRQATVDILSYPGLLVELAQTAAKTRAQFQTLMSAQPMELQKEVWKVVRYPKLLRQLTAFGVQDEKAIKATVSSFPKEIQEPALDLAKNHFDLLEKVSALHRQALQGFSQTMQSEPANVKDAFRTVGQHSEILQVLAQMLKLNSITPAEFKKNPGPLTQQAKAIADKIQQTPIESHQVNIQAGSQDDPQAVATLRKAADDFAQQNDYAFDQDPYSKNAAQVNVGYTPYSSVFTPVGWAYPVWFGWPAWDPYPYL